MDVERASQPGRPAGPQAAVPHEGAACLGRPGACRGESGGVLLCRHRVGGGRVTRVARPPSSALRGFSTLRTVSCLSLRTHVAVAGGNPACEPRLPSSGQASPAPGAEGKAGGRVAGGARATGTAGRHPGPRNRGRAGGAARGLGARSRTGGTPGCGHAAPAPPRPRPATPGPAHSTASPWCPWRPSPRSSWSPGSTVSAAMAPSASAGSVAGGVAGGRAGRDGGLTPLLSPGPPAWPPASRSRRSPSSSGTARCCRCRPASR